MEQDTSSYSKTAETGAHQHKRLQLKKGLVSVCFSFRSLNIYFYILYIAAGPQFETSLISRVKADDKAAILKKPSWSSIM